MSFSFLIRNEILVCVQIINCSKRLKSICRIRRKRDVIKKLLDFRLISVGHTHTHKNTHTGFMDTKPLKFE